MSHDDSDVLTLTLYDNKIDGAMKCLGETCVVYKIPRESLKDYMDIDDLNNAGIYFIYGKRTGDFKIYVGQTEVRKNGKGLLNRVREHDTQKKDYWDMAIMLLRTTTPLDAADLNYLENYFEDELRKLYGVNCMNKVPPHNSGVTSEKETKLKRFIKEVDTNTQILGCNVVTHGENKIKMHAKNTSNPSDSDIPFEALCNEIKKYILGISKDIDESPQKHYIAYKYDGENIICLETKPSKKSIYLYLKLNADIYFSEISSMDTNSVSVRDMRNIGHYGTGDIRVEIKDRASLESAKGWIVECVSAYVPKLY